MKYSLSLFAIPLLVLAADWDAKTFPNWSESAVLKLLTDSPWTRQKTVSFQWVKKNEQPFTYKDVPGADPSKTAPMGSPVGGIGKPKSHLPDKADILLRWTSALPIRQAKALYQQRDEKLPAEKLDGLVAKSDGDFVLEIFGLPAEIAHKGAGSVESVIKQSAYLRAKTGRTMRPSRVEVNLSALTLNILIHFAKADALKLEEKEVEFYADVQLFELKERFRLSSMVFAGKLEM